MTLKLFYEWELYCSSEYIYILKQEFILRGNYILIEENGYYLNKSMKYI